VGFLRKFQLLNLDIVVGAVLNGIFFAVCFRTRITWFTLLTLAIAVWIIYTGDRLLDTRKSGNMPDTPRHRFHQKNKKWLLAGISVSALVALLVIPLLPMVTVMYGLGLFFIVLSYFIFLMFFKPIFFPKEPVIALLYTCGVALPAFSLSLPEGSMFIIILQHATLAFLNLLLISSHEVTIDTKSGHHSLAIGLGKKRTETVLLVLFWLLFLSILINLIVYHEMFSFMIQATLLCMWGVLFMIKFSWGYFKKNDRYRTWADMAFWIPGWIIWL